MREQGSKQKNSKLFTSTTKDTKLSKQWLCLSQNILTIENWNDLFFPTLSFSVSCPGGNEDNMRMSSTLLQIPQKNNEEKTSTIPNQRERPYR